MTPDGNAAPPLPVVADPQSVAVAANAANRGVALSYRSTLMLGVCGLVLVTGLVVTWVAHRAASNSTEALAAELFEEVSSHAVTHTRGFVLRAAPLVESLEHLHGRGLAVDNPDQLAGQLLSFLQGNPGLSWISYGKENGDFVGVYRPIEGGLRVNQSHIEDGHTLLIENDVLPDGQWRVARRDNDSGYDPRSRPFYRQAKQERRLVWLPPYIFFNQGVPGISCAAPLYDGAGGLEGVLSVDFDLNSLSDFVAGLSVSPNSEVFLFTADQTLLAHKRQKMEPPVTGQAPAGLPTLADVRDPLVQAYRASLRPEYIQPTEGNNFHKFEFDQGGNRYMASATAFHVGSDLVWVIGAIAPKSDFFAGVWRSQALSLLVGGAAVLVAVALAATLAQRVSGPVLSLIGFMRRVGEGDLEAHADLGGSREFHELAHALNRMIADLRDRLRLRHSLNVAMEVQQRLLPGGPPKVPGLDVAGHSTYCDETGGDYYDFLILDEAAPDNLLVALGDVMGHGVAAALVMAGARAVLRDRAPAVGSLASLMSHLNRLITADHEGTRFMTMHLSIINTRSGEFRWVSAGHDPALLYDPATGQFQELEGGDLPLGIVDDTEFAEFSYGPLRPGQIIVIGTDGVWEMPSATGELFGKQRMQAAIRAAAGETSEVIAQALLASLTQFRGECPTVDDVTFVIVKVGDAVAVSEN